MKYNHNIFPKVKRKATRNVLNRPNSHRSQHNKYELRKKKIGMRRVQYQLQLSEEKAYRIQILERKKQAVAQLMPKHESLLSK